MSQIDKFKQSLNAAINTPNNPTGKYMTPQVKAFINKVAAKLPNCYLGQVDKHRYDNPPEKELLIMDYVLGQKMGKAGYFEFVEGKELPNFPSRVFLYNITSINQAKHKVNLRDAYKEHGGEGIANYITLVYSAVSYLFTKELVSSTIESL